METCKVLTVIEEPIPPIPPIPPIECKEDEIAIFGYCVSWWILIAIIVAIVVVIGIVLWTGKKKKK